MDLTWGSMTCFPYAVPSPDLRPFHEIYALFHWVRIEAVEVCGTDENHLNGSRREFDFGNVKRAVHMFYVLRASMLSDKSPRRTEIASFGLVGSNHFTRMCPRARGRFLAATLT